MLFLSFGRSFRFVDILSGYHWLFGGFRRKGSKERGLGVYLGGGTECFT
jgi:hypothetical protein